MVLNGVEHTSIGEGARRMYRRVLASWAQDALALRRRGWDVPGASPSAIQRHPGLARGPVQPPTRRTAGASRAA